MMGEKIMVTNHYAMAGFALPPLFKTSTGAGVEATVQYRY